MLFKSKAQRRKFAELPGLAIVKGIIDAHGGTVAVTSVSGEGTAVRFTLPVAERRSS